MKSFLRILGILIIVAILVLLGYYIFRKPDTATAPTATTPVSQGNTATTSATVAATPANGAGNQTFTDSTFGISYEYPSDVALQSFTTSGGSPSWSVNSSTGGTLISEATLDQSFEPKTNFAGATFTVGASSNATSIAQCTTAQNGEKLVGPSSINGQNFLKFTLSDAGAGNFYDTTSYRIVHDGQCFVVEYTIHSTDIGNYDPSQGISMFNEPMVVSKMDAMVQSFMFTK